MAFDPDAYLETPASSGFDPDAYLSGKENKKSPSQKIEAAVEGFGQGASFGYLPQLNAVVEKYITDPLAEKVYGTPQTDESYVERRDRQINRQKQLYADNPGIAKGSEIAGGLATGIATSGIVPVGAAKSAMGKIGQGVLSGAGSGALYGAISNPGDVEGEISEAQIPERLKNAAVGAVVGGAAGGAMTSGVESVKQGAKLVRKAGDKLKDFAEKAAVNATGATGKQASEFSDKAGRELLDRGIVKFGDSQEKIAERAAKAVKSAYTDIDTALGKLEKDGIKVDANKIYETVRSKIDDIAADPSQADIARLLEKELDNLIKSTDAKGSTSFGIKEAEKIKRGYNRKAGNWADPEKGQAGKEMYQTYRRAVEDVAQSADPKTASLFKEGKESYALLAPIEEAAQRRASTTSQSPAGGLLDMASGGAGLAAGGPVGGVLAPIARRIAAPRISSSLAVSSDKLADILRKIPNAAELQAKNPAALVRLINSMGNLEKGSAPSKAADSFQKDQERPLPKKGPDKWANDGAEKLKAHSGGSILSDQAAVEELMQSKKGKDLLIQASDLKPGSKAMQVVLTKIKSQLGGFNE